MTVPALDGEGASPELEELDEAEDRLLRPNAFDAYLIQRVLDYRGRVEAELDGSSVSAAQEFYSIVSKSFQNRLYLQRPETSLDLLAIDFKEAIPTDFLSDRLPK